MKSKLTLPEALATKVAVGFRLQSLTDKICELHSNQSVSSDDLELINSMLEEVHLLEVVQKKLFYFTSVEL